MPSLGPTELIIILAIVVVIFGVGRLPDLGRGVGKSIHDFRKSVRGDDKKATDDKSPTDQEQD